MHCSFDEKGQKIFYIGLLHRLAIVGYQDNGNIEFKYNGA